MGHWIKIWVIEEDWKLFQEIKQKLGIVQDTELMKRILQEYLVRYKVEKEKEQK